MFNMEIGIRFIKISCALSVFYAVMQENASLLFDFFTDIYVVRQKYKKLP